MGQDHAADVARYIEGVVSGEIVTGRLERLAVYRHLDDLEKAGDRGFYFDEAKACKAINFSSLCRQFESPFAGLPLELRLDQKFVVWCMMGWRQKENGFRRFRHVQYELARKGGKSTISAYLACLLLFMDSPLEMGAQGYVAATKQSQAKIVWRAAQKMIEKSPALKKRAKITESQLMIEVPQFDNVFRPLATDKTPDGFNPHFIIKDEEHAWRENHRSQADTLGSGFGTRNQPITITITTYGNTDSALWKENHDYAVACLESIISGEIVDDTWFAFICALDYPQETPCYRCKGESCPWCDGSGIIKPDDPYNELVWRKANPGIGPGPGFTPQLERMREYANVAKRRPDKRSEFFQKNLNIIVSSKERAIHPENWLACRGELSDWTHADVRGAFDLGRSNDFAALALVAQFAMTDDDGKDFIRYEVRSRSWTCEERAEEVQTEQVRRWVEEGLVDQSDGDQISFADIENAIREFTALYGVVTWAHDPHFALQMGQRLIEEFGEEAVFKFTQNAFRYNEPVRKFQRLTTEVHIVNGEPVRALVHDGDPVLSWQVSNLVIRKNALDHWMPDKGASANKIDAAVALLMALSESMYAEQNGLWKPESIRL